MHTETAWTAQDSGALFLLRIMLVETGEETEGRSGGLCRNFAPSIRHNGTDRLRQTKIFDFMATKNASNSKAVNPTTENASANEVSKSATTAAKTQRVLETRDDWERIKTHMATLVATLAKGEALPDKCRDGFGFAKVADSPHSRDYAKSLLAGFVSRKSAKFFTEGELADIDKRNEIALAILLDTKLGGTSADKAKAALSKAEPKQVKAFADQVLTLITK